MGQTLRSELVGTAGLTIAASAAMLLAVLRRPIAANGERHRAATVFALLALVQALHGAEEYATRFSPSRPSPTALPTPCWRCAPAATSQAWSRRRCLPSAASCSGGS